jgi:hypothetical protein
MLLRLVILLLILSQLRVFLSLLPTIVVVMARMLLMMVVLASLFRLIKLSRRDLPILHVSSDVVPPAAAAGRRAAAPSCDVVAQDFHLQSETDFHVHEFERRHDMKKVEVDLELLESL